MQDAQRAVPLDALRAAPLAEQDATARQDAQQAKAVPQSAQDALPDVPMGTDAPQHRPREQQQDDPLQPDAQDARSAFQAGPTESDAPQHRPREQSQDDRLQPDAQDGHSASQAGRTESDAPQHRPREQQQDDHLQPDDHSVFQAALWERCVLRGRQAVPPTEPSDVRL